MSETKLAEVNATLDELLTKTKYHDVELLHLSNNVFDYSFQEMASNFDERVDNRLMTIKQQIQELSHNISSLNKAKKVDDSTVKLTETIQKMVNNKLDCYTDGINQKLVHIAQSNGASIKVPTETVDGKKILYKCEGKIVQPDDVFTSVDGSVKMKKERKEGQNSLTPKNTRRVSFTESYTPQESKSSQKKQSNYERLKVVREKNKKKLARKPDHQNDEIQSYGNIYFKGSHSLQQTQPSCKFGEKCWNRDCTRRHSNSSNSYREPPTQHYYSHIPQFQTPPQQYKPFNPYDDPRSNGKYETTGRNFEHRLNVPIIHPQQSSAPTLWGWYPTY